MLLIVVCVVGAGIAFFFLQSRRRRDLKDSDARINLLKRRKR